MFGAVQPTEFDLQFRLFGIPVRVLPWFWLLAALLGGDLLRIDEGWKYLVAWMVVVFFSILVHEMGHALTARVFGYFPRVFLYQFGGVAMYTPDSEYTAGRSILITFAGPAAGLALGLGTLVGTFVLATSQVHLQPLVEATLMFLIEVNIAWSILNLLPVYPLDGGQITRDVCTSMNPRRGMIWTLWISVLVALLIALAAFSLRQTFLGIMFGLMCYQNFQMLQMRRY
jgi:stage IV sporulation protein FB